MSEREPRFHHADDDHGGKTPSERGVENVGMPITAHPGYDSGIDLCRTGVFDKLDWLNN